MGRKFQDNNSHNYYYYIGTMGHILNGDSLTVQVKSRSCAISVEKRFPNRVTWCRTSTPTQTRDPSNVSSAVRVSLRVVICGITNVFTWVSTRPSGPARSRRPPTRFPFQDSLPFILLSLLPVTVAGVRPYHCAQCNKTFTQSGHLVNHLRLHDGEKPFRCVVCGKRFTQSGHLSTHAKIHSNGKMHRCKICLKTFVLVGRFHPIAFMFPFINRFSPNGCVCISHLVGDPP